MFKLALLGRDISYTVSPSIHAAIAQATGEQIDFGIADVKYDMLEQTLKTLLENYDGFFVTKPFKQEIKKHIDCGDNFSVNVVRTSDKAVFNTDGIGFIRALDRAFPDWKNDVNGVLILGAGGAAYAVAKSLVERGKKVYVLNRTLMHAVKMCKAVGTELYVNQPTELIVNCTSLGLAGEDVLRSLCVLPDFEYAFDLIYSGEDTPFLRRLKSNGAKTSNGFSMLVYQAIEGDKLLFGKNMDVESVYECVMKLLDK